MPDVYKLFLPEQIKAPILLSVPHAGTAFPDEIKDVYRQKLLPPDDTDWWVDRLYAFAKNIGIPVITAHFSRWVIDLNRNPNDKPLYNDGRQITGLCPTTNFLGECIYIDERKTIDDAEISRRKNLYFKPYHQKIQELLATIKQQFGKVLLWDCHSIRRKVSSISTTPFPDFILGSADEISAEKYIIDKALKSLRSGKYEVAHNHPFKGGFITRHFGKPQLQQHALQLEMCKDLYMNDTETTYDENKASEIQALLQKTLETLAVELTRL